MNAEEAGGRGLANCNDDYWKDDEDRKDLERA